MKPHSFALWLGENACIILHSFVMEIQIHWQTSWIWFTPLPLPLGLEDKDGVKNCLRWCCTSASCDSIFHFTSSSSSLRAWLVLMYSLNISKFLLFLTLQLTTGRKWIATTWVRKWSHGQEYFNKPFLEGSLNLYWGGVEVNLNWIDVKSNTLMLYCVLSWFDMNSCIESNFYILNECHQLA